MYQRYKERFGTAGVVLGVIALILALGGTALAASKLNGTQKKEVEKIAKKYAGKPGAPGAAGANGTNGTNGKDGTGAPGAPGAPGVSVTNVEEPPGGECEEGGAKFTVGSGAPTYACNGEEGPEGAEGSPWTAGGTLPAGATETGAWAFTATAPASEYYVPISIPIKLKEELGGSQVHVGFAGSPGFSDTCHGNPENPTAPAGTLCVYITEVQGATFTESLNLPRGSAGVSTAGTFLLFNVTAPGFGAGAWAVGGE